MRISDWSSDVCSSDLENRHKPEAVAIAAGDARFLGGEVEQRQDGAALLVEIGLTPARLDALAHLVVAGGLRLGPNRPQVRADNGMSDHQAQRDLRMTGQRGAHGGMAMQADIGDRKSTRLNPSHYWETRLPA